MTKTPNLAENRAPEDQTHGKCIHANSVVHKHSELVEFCQLERVLEVSVLEGRNEGKKALRPSVFASWSVKYIITVSTALRMFSAVVIDKAAKAA